MVSIKNLLLVGCAVMGAIAAPVDSSASLQPFEARGVTSPVVGDLEVRNPPAPSHMRIAWSATGRIVFGMGASFPQSLLESWALGGAGPAKVLYHQFVDWINSYNGLHNVPDLLEPPNLNPANNPIVGGIYGIAQGFTNHFGIAVQLRGNNVNAQNIQDMVKALYAWASQNGGVVEIVQTASIDSMNLSLMGANVNNKIKRSRTNECPANPPNMLNYADQDAPGDNDWTQDFRYAAPCSA